MGGSVQARRSSGPGGFDPALLRARLQPFTLEPPHVPDALEAAYFSYYGIDFEQRFPGLTHHFGVLDADGFRIACHFYDLQGARGSCVLMHGYFDHAGLYGHLIEHCLGRGYSVLIWDLPGHGLSNGRQASIRDFDDYTAVLTRVLERLREQLPAPLIAIGQSTGSAILMSWAFRQHACATACPFERIALLAPLVRPARWGSVRFLHTVIRPFRDGVRRKFMDNSSDRQFLDFVRADPLQSLVLPVPWVTAMRAWVRRFDKSPVVELAPLVVQGTEDETVDWRWNLAMIRRKFPHADVRMLEGARHQLVNESPPIRDAVFAALALG